MKFDVVLKQIEDRQPDHYCDSEYHDVEIKILIARVKRLSEALIESRMQFTDCICRVKSPEPYMIKDIDKALEEE